MLQKILEKVFITKKFTQCKTRTLKIDVFEIPDKNIKKNYFQNGNCFSWIKLIPVLIHLKYWYCNSPNLELPYLPCYFCPIFFYTVLFNTILIMLLIGFPILSYAIRPHATTGIGYTKPYANPSQSSLISSYIKIIVPYGSNTLQIKKLSY